MKFDNAGPTADDMFAALDAAYATARAAHEAGTCSASEWSCSYCEGEAL